MFRDGQQVLDCNLQQLKLFLKMDSLFELQTFFTEALPDYSQMKEKPAAYESDPGNYKRYEYNVQLVDSVICFEQLRRPEDDFEAFTGYAGEHVAQASPEELDE